MDSESCRLCSAPNTNSHLNIFSGRGIKLGMVDILSKHFNNISEADPLPKYVCSSCWAITTAFHELYKKSKEVQEKFIDSLVKIEHDPIELPSSNVDCNPLVVEEVIPIKLEPNSVEGDNELENAPLVESLNDSAGDSDVENFDDNNEGVNENAQKDDSECRTRKRKEKRKQLKSKKDNKEFQKTFKENKHLFDLSCDCCSKIFGSLDEARKHYSTEHGNPKGYIKSTSGKKIFYNCEVVQYLKRHFNPDKFKCTECDQTFTYKSSLNRHMKGHQEATVKPKEKLIQCDICGKSFSRQKSLLEHKRVHENDPLDSKMYEMYQQFIADHFDMTCDQCNAKFTALHEASRHYKECHNEANGWIKCCGKKLSKLWMIRDHINTHIHAETVKCDLCNKTFKTRKLMIKHKHRHKAFICDYCGKTCHNKESILCHLFTNHVSSEPKFECQICNKKFQLNALLKNHMYAAHREKKATVTCEICGKTFYAKFFLLKHMVTAHTDKSERLAMRKQCEFCGDWLLSKSGIYYHKQLHTSGIQKCEKCGMELPNRPALMGHIREHHRDHKHKCSYCDKTFVNAYKLRAHEESHTRHKIYQCKFCPRTFTVSSSLSTHTQRNHKEEWESAKRLKI